LNWRRKILASLQRILELSTQTIVIKLSKIWVLDPRSGIQKRPIPDHPRDKKAPDPGSATLITMLPSGYVGASQAPIFISIFQATIEVAAANDSSGERRQQLLPFLPPGISISLAAGGGKAAAVAAPASPGVSPPLGNTPPPAPYFPAKCPTCDKGGRSSEL
jgi:hypothetical protein